MTDELIYKKEMYSDEIVFDLASRFFSFRMKKNLSLMQVSKMTGIEMQKIDKLEIYATDIDFTILARLLDFYGENLESYEQCFPNLSKECYQKYFKKN